MSNLGMNNGIFASLTTTSKNVPSVKEIYVALYDLGIADAMPINISQCPEGWIMKFESERDRDVVIRLEVLKAKEFTLELANIPEQVNNYKASTKENESSGSAMKSEDHGSSCSDKIETNEKFGGAEAVDCANKGTESTEKVEDLPVHGDESGIDTVVCGMQNLTATSKQESIDYDEYGYTAELMAEAELFNVHPDDLKEMNEDFCSMQAAMRASGSSYADSSYPPYVGYYGCVDLEHEYDDLSDREPDGW